MAHNLHQSKLNFSSIAPHTFASSGASTSHKRPHEEYSGESSNTGSRHQPIIIDSSGSEAASIGSDDDETSDSSGFSSEEDNDGSEEDEDERTNTLDVTEDKSSNFEHLFLLPPSSPTTSSDLVLRIRFGEVYNTIRHYPDNIPFWQSLLIPENEEKWFKLFRFFYLAPALIPLLINASPPTSAELVAIGYLTEGFGAYSKLGVSNDLEREDMVYIGSAAAKPTKDTNYRGTHSRRLEHKNSCNKKQKGGGLFDNLFRFYRPGFVLDFCTLWFFPVNRKTASLKYIRTGQVGARFTEAILSQWLLSWSINQIGQNPARVGTSFWNVHSFSYIGTNISNPLRNSMHMINGLTEFRRNSDEWKSYIKDKRRKNRQKLRLKNREEINQKQREDYQHQTVKQKHSHKVAQRKYEAKPSSKQKAQERNALRAPFLSEYGKAYRGGATDQELIAIAVKYGKQPRLYSVKGKRGTKI